MDRRVLRFRRKLKARLIAAGLTLAVAITLAGLLAASLTRAAPSWWRLYRPTAELRDHAADFENAAVSQLYRRRPDDPDWVRSGRTGPWRSTPWSIFIRDEDASAWLTARLPEWINGQEGLAWPIALSQPQVSFHDGVVRLGVLLRNDDRPRILTASVRPEIRPDGSLWLRSRWIHIGRLPVPAAFLLARAESRLDGYLPDDVADDPFSHRFIEILRGRAPLAQRPEMRLDDGRTVRLLAVRVLDGRIELDCRTEARDALAQQ